MMAKEKDAHMLTCFCRILSKCTGSPLQPCIRALPALNLSPLLVIPAPHYTINNANLFIQEVFF